MAVTIIVNPPIIITALLKGLAFLRKPMITAIKKGNKIRKFTAFNIVIAKVFRPFQMLFQIFLAHEFFKNLSMASFNSLTASSSPS